VSGATQYSLLIGSSPGASHIYNNGNLGTATSVAATLPSIGTVYATLGTQTNMGSQTTSAVYTINPNASTLPLVLGQAPPVSVPNNGTAVQYVYYFG